MAVLGMAGGLMVAGVVTFLMPTIYESEVTIEVKPLLFEIRSTEEGDESEPIKDDETPVHLKQSLKQVGSAGLLGRVVGKLALAREWSVDQPAAVIALEKKVKVANIRGTDLISIRVRDTEKERARDIAAQIAGSFGEYRKVLGQLDREKGMGDMSRKLKDLEDRVEERTKVLRTVPVPLYPDAPRRWGLDYADLKKDLELALADLQSMNIKSIEVKRSYEIHDGSVVIHEEPQIPKAPVSPDVPLNLLIGTGLGFLLSPLLSVVGIRNWRSKRKKSGSSDLNGRDEHHCRDSRDEGSPFHR